MPTGCWWTDRSGPPPSRAAARDSIAVDVAFWGGAVPSNAGRLGALHRAGVTGFECFLVDSGVPEFPPLDEAGLLAAMQEVAALDALLVVHAEDAATIGATPPGRARPAAGVRMLAPRSHARWIRARARRYRDGACGCRHSVVSQERLAGSGRTTPAVHPAQADSPADRGDPADR